MCVSVFAACEQSDRIKDMVWTEYRLRALRLAWRSGGMSRGVQRRPAVPRVPRWNRDTHRTVSFTHETNVEMYVNIINITKDEF